MDQVQDPQDRATFGDVLLARRYLRDLRDTRKLTPDLQALPAAQWTAAFGG